MLDKVVTSILRNEAPAEVKNPGTILDPLTTNRLDCGGRVRFLYDDVLYNVTVTEGQICADVE